MRIFGKTIRPAAIAVPVLVGVCSMAMGAAVGINWRKSEVTPVVLVKPDSGEFVPVERRYSTMTWKKGDVQPVVVVKPFSGGFVPCQGISISQSWKKEDVQPVVQVEPWLGDKFIACEDQIPLARSSDTSPIPKVRVPDLDDDELSATTIESKIDGDFEGWDGDTIIKLENGQVWQQEDYYCSFDYAYCPKVIIFKSGSKMKMKVVGTDRSVEVKQLK